jgi:hypothetical protein
VDKARVKLAEWRALGRQTVISRQIVRKAMIGRVKVTPEGDKTIMEGIGTPKGLFGGELLSQGLASPKAAKPYSDAVRVTSPTGLASLWYAKKLRKMRAA